uniref:SCR1 protein n=1 Tax=Schwanniomyces occidentalis TaxID=27300 RepID=Q8X1Y6_SCHOC|nr:SCR1 protein [Schwanniomyces occidentalis]
MHYRFIRDSFWGRFAYMLSGHKLFKHKEEMGDYVIPPKYRGEISHIEGDSLAETKEQAEMVRDDSVSSSSVSKNDDLIIVDWDGEDDPDNPYNWPLYQKVFLLFEVGFLTVSVYMGAAIYTPGIDKIMEQFNVGNTLATLPLALFVIGYGLGPMVLSPMTETAAIGRTSVYIITLFLFFILQIPTALSKNIASLCILRFISGFFASPALATGGATIGDVISMPYMPVGLASWAVGAVCGPSFGPLFGSVLTVKGGWRWTFWFMATISGICFLFLGLFLPETYGKTLLYRKAKRLRALTGNKNITSEGEIEMKKMTLNELAIDTLWRPIEITLIEPVVLLINIYIALVYSVMYLWFEAFPIVFLEVHHFTLVEMGVTYVSIMLGILFGATVYIPTIYRQFTKKLLNGIPVAPEVFLPSAIVGSILMPIGIFIFGWTASPDIHWIAPTIGAAIFALGAFIIFQTLFNYLGSSFWRYLASVFAGNALFRSVIAGCFPLFGRALFNNLSTPKYPVAWGSSILGFISVGMISIPVFFFLNGPKLRARSRYAT